MKQFISKSISYGWAAIHHYNPLLNFFVLIGQNALRGTKLDDEYPRGRGGWGHTQDFKFSSDRDDQRKDFFRFEIQSV